MLKDRLHKVIAASGVCSRREAELLIADGRVSVNGKRVGKMGVKVSAEDEIRIDNQLLPEKAPIMTVAMHKPKGVLTSKSDPFHDKTVMDLLPADYAHLNPIGRLDKDSEGLLLFTSDGALLEKLTHPRFGHEKVYHVLVHGIPTESELEEVRNGKLQLDGYTLQPMKAEVWKPEGNTTWLRMVLKEGRKRQIRRVMEIIKHPTIRLIRVAIGGVELGDLKPGEYRTLSDAEVKLLQVPADL